TPRAKHYDAALYERAWALHKLGKTRDAVAVLNSLVASQTKSSLIPQAELSRGELWLRHQNYTLARTEYDHAHTHFDRLYHQLVTNADQQPDLNAYFQQLAKTQGIRLQWTELVPEETWSWFQKDPEFTTALRTLDDAQQL